ncbi:hypothetical protein [Streptomyces sp. ME18-1-4]|uniref:hypothetical protein n=1 Tax=Streptomyces sp. ME18-1-4 TaxID=3028685 RepID=UPI0029B4838C|nr:hypothetical protein [Streptomyces sp. ME18-1-4]MDX3240790.1 hypothetical protein [Streptomyces sp. ME18-1-4]
MSRRDRAGSLRAGLVVVLDEPTEQDAPPATPEGCTIGDLDLSALVTERIGLEDIPAACAVPALVVLMSWLVLGEVPGPLTGQLRPGEAGARGFRTGTAGASPAPAR